MCASWINLKLCTQMTLHMLSEPEAACQWATMSDPIRVNEVLMVVDLGGGTIDITVHRIGKRPPPECDYIAADRSYVLLDAHLKV
jgi:molecular chaperone DnaK (HSP70)